MPLNKTIQDKSNNLKCKTNLQICFDYRNVKECLNHDNKNKTGSNHRYLIEINCSSGKFKSGNLEDKEYTKKYKCTKFSHNKYLIDIQPWWLGSRVLASLEARLCAGGLIPAWGMVPSM